MDVLRAMGARTDVRGGSARKGEDRELELIRAWLLGHRVNTVVVCHASNVLSPHWFGPLLEITEHVGAELLLVTDHGLDCPLNEWTDTQGVSIEADVDLPALIASRSRTVPISDDGCRYFPRMLPRAPFTVWRARVRATLRPSEFELVDALYRASFATVLSDPPNTADHAVDVLEQLLTDVGEPDEALTVTKALQAAAFRAGWHVAVNLGAVLGAVADHQHRPMTPTEVRALRAYREPWVGVAAVVRDMDLEYNNMRKIKLRNVDEDGHYTQRGLNRDVPDAALPIMRAQRALRIIEGAGPNDPFLTVDSRDIADAVRWSKADLNISGVARSARRVRWQDALRMTVQPLEGR
ncbi:hypothetical protein [Nostocoides australiense]